MWCAVQRNIAVLQLHCLLNNVVCSTAIVCCTTEALSDEQCGVHTAIDCCATVALSAE